MYLLEEIWKVLMKKKWGSNRRKWFYSECGKATYDGSIETVEYSCVNNWCMLD